MSSESSLTAFDPEVVALAERAAETGCLEASSASLVYHCRVYMRSFDANAEQRLARQFLNEWHATTTTITTNAKVYGETPTLKGHGHDLPLSINGNAVDTRPRCRQHRTIGPTSTIRAPKDPARHRVSSPLTNRLLPSCEK